MNEAKYFVWYNLTYVNSVAQYMSAVTMVFYLIVQGDY